MLFLSPRAAPVIDSEVLDNMRSSDFVSYAPKPPHIRRNQVPYDLERDMRDHVPESPMMRGQSSTLRGVDVFRVFLYPTQKITRYRLYPSHFDKWR